MTKKRAQQGKRKKKSTEGQVHKKKKKNQVNSRSENKNKDTAGQAAGYGVSHSKDSGVTTAG